MSVLRGTTGAEKSVCERCMAVHRVPLDSANPKGETRDPVPWSDKDEELWEAGLVLCPFSGSPSKPDMSWCLCSNELRVRRLGVISIWDELAETEEISLETAQRRKRRFVFGVEGRWRSCHCRGCGGVGGVISGWTFSRMESRDTRD